MTLPCQASPSSSGVTATGLNALAGLDWKKPKPLASSPGIRPRKDTSLTSMTSLMWPAASSFDTPIGTSSVTTAISPSMSQPQLVSFSGMSARGGRKVSLPPWYISGS